MLFLLFLLLLLLLLLVVVVVVMTMYRFISKEDGMECALEDVFRDCIDGVDDERNGRERQHGGSPASDARHGGEKIHTFDSLFAHVDDRMDGEGRKCH